MVWFDRESGEDMYCTGFEQLPAPLLGLLIDPTLYATSFIAEFSASVYSDYSGVLYMSVVACRSPDVSASQCPRRSSTRACFVCRSCAMIFLVMMAAANSAARHCCNRIVAM